MPLLIPIILKQAALANTPEEDVTIAAFTLLACCPVHKKHILPLVALYQAKDVIVKRNLYDTWYYPSVPPWKTHSYTFVSCQWISS